MQCTGHSGCFPGRGAAMARLFCFSPLSAVFRVSVPPDIRPTPLRQIDMGPLTCAHMWVRAATASTQKTSKPTEAGNSHTAHQAAQRQ